MSAMCLEFIILTAVRVSEATEAVWPEIDWDKALWVIPKERMKMDREHKVPLSDRALAILKALHAVKGKNQHIFPGVRPGQGVARTTVFDQSERVTGGAASPHGWRATFGTWCDQHGVDTIVSELCLAHTKEALAKAYKRGDLISAAARRCSNGRTGYRDRRRRMSSHWRGGGRDHGPHRDHRSRLGRRRRHPAARMYLDALSLASHAARPLCRRPISAPSLIPRPTTFTPIASAVPATSSPRPGLYVRL